MRVFQKVNDNMKPLSYYFYVRTRILVVFHICISAPLIAILLILAKKILHPHFGAYQRVLGGMYGTRVHTSLTLSLD